MGLYMNLYIHMYLCVYVYIFMANYMNLHLLECKMMCIYKRYINGI